MKKDSKVLYTTSFTSNGKRYYVRAKTQKLLWQKAAQKQHDLESGILTANGNTTVAPRSRSRDCSLPPRAGSGAKKENIISYRRGKWRLTKRK